MSVTVARVLVDSSGNEVGVFLDGAVYRFESRSTLRSTAKGTSVAGDITSTPVDANVEALHVDGSKVDQPVIIVGDDGSAIAVQRGGAFFVRTTDPTVMNTLKGILTELREMNHHFRAMTEERFERTEIEECEH